MDDPYRITRPEQLRQVIAAPRVGSPSKVMAALDEPARQFIGQSPLVFVATAGEGFELDVSPKGDEPGFVQVDDASTLLLPERSGNRLTFGFHNILQTGRIGLIFVVPGVRETLRVNGRAEITADPALLQRLASQGKPALLATRVAVQECFFHCGKAFIRSRTWDPATWPAGPARTAALANWSRVFAMSEEAIGKILDDDYRHNL